MGDDEVHDASEQPSGARRWMTGDHIGVALLWLLIVASVCVIAAVAWNLLQGTR